MCQVHQSFKADVRLCGSCGRFLSAKAFDPSPTAHAVSRCHQCSQLQNAAVARKDASPYEAMLQRVQQSEVRQAEPSRLCFLISAQDIQKLVEHVWGARSALSQHSELHHLSLARWNRDEPWAPWNCILVTEDESKVHASLADPNAAYADALIARMRQRFTQARIMFSRLTAEEDVFVSAESTPA